METEKPDNWDIVFKEYYSVSMDSITPLSYVGPNNNKIPSFGTDLYAKKEFNSFFFVNENGATKIDIENNISCDDSSIGRLDSNESVCLGMNSSGSLVSLAFTSGNDEEYILTNPSSDSKFSISTGNDGIILKQTPNVIYHDISQSGKFYYYFF